MDVVVERFKTKASTAGQTPLGLGPPVSGWPQDHVVSASSGLTASRLRESDRPRGGEGMTRMAVLLSDVIALLVVTSATLIIASAVGLHPAPWVLATLWAGLILLYLLAGFYNHVVVHPATEIRAMMRITAFVFLGVFVGLRVGGVTDTDIVVTLFGLVALFVVPLLRSFTRVICARSAWWGLPVVVVSYNGVGREIVNGLRRWPEMGLRPVALFEESTTVPETKTNEMESDMRAGNPRDAARIAAALGVRDVIISLPATNDGRNADKVRYYTKMFRRVYRLRDGRSDSTFWTTLPVHEHFAGVFAANAHASNRGYRVLKRVLDVLVSLAGGIVLLPVLLAISVFIRLDSRGPVLFTQQRMGRSGRIYSVYKFRTMYQGSQGQLSEILANDEERKKEYVAFHKLSDDPRVTSFGSFLRRYSLDELPQLWNVFVGEMSLVGPRAYVPDEISDMVGLERVVLQVRPGLTGLWQVSGRNELSFLSRVDLDGEYIQNATLWLDLYIIVRTLPAVLSGHGAG